MRVRALVATDAADGQYGELIRTASGARPLRAMDAALAYATQGGVSEVCQILDRVDNWQRVQKRWLVGIDYCRSDPLAIAHLRALPRSDVRVHDGAFVVRRRGCPPRVSFHPKVYVFRGLGGTNTVLGSGNLSRTGLRLGIEAGVCISAAGAQPLAGLSRWYSRLWEAATPIAEIEAQYSVKYGELENRRVPFPVEDDAVPPSAGNRGQLAAEQLRQLRVCANLWIETGNLHLNRGAGRPGNQLMLKRNTRVYFGFPARDLAVDTLVGSVALRYGPSEESGFSLRFSNNSMDVLNLPIPGAGGPAKYDQEVLLFRRVGVQRFSLTLGSPNEVASWQRESARINASFQMSSGGRRWGVF